MLLRFASNIDETSYMILIYHLTYQITGRLSYVSALLVYIQSVFINPGHFVLSKHFAVYPKIPSKAQTREKATLSLTKYVVSAGASAYNVSQLSVRV